MAINNMATKSQTRLPVAPSRLLASSRPIAAAAPPVYKPAATLASVQRRPTPFRGIHPKAAAPLQGVRSVLRPRAPVLSRTPVVMRQKFSQPLRVKAAALQTVAGAIPSGGVVQRLAANVFAVRELGSADRSNATLKFYKSKIDTWITALSQYELWEDRNTEWAPFRLPQIAYHIYREAIQRLDELVSAGAEVLKALDNFKQRPEVRAFLDKCAAVITAMKEDRAEYVTKQQEAVEDYQTLQSSISVDNYRAIKRTGHMGLRAVKWWRTASQEHPGHNFEITVLAGGQPWAKVHVYWDIGKDPATDAPNGASFKDANGDSIYGGRILNAQDLIDEFVNVARQYLGSLPADYKYRDQNV